MRIALRAQAESCIGLLHYNSDLFMNENLKKLRQELGLTQAAFAANVGVSKDAVASWETGRNRLSAGMARRIALATGVEARTLQGGGPLQTRGPGTRRRFTREEFQRHHARFWGTDAEACVPRHVSRCGEALELLLTAAARAGEGSGAARLGALLDSFAQWCNRARTDFQLERAIDAQLAERKRPLKLKKSFKQWRAMAESDPDVVRLFGFVDDPAREDAELLELEADTIPVWWPGGAMRGKI